MRSGTAPTILDELYINKMREMPFSQDSVYDHMNDHKAISSDLRSRHPQKARYSIDTLPAAIDMQRAESAHSLVAGSQSKETSSRGEIIYNDRAIHGARSSSMPRKARHDDSQPHEVTSGTAKLGRPAKKLK